MQTANNYYRSRFGCKIYRLSLDGGFTCPNRDGTLGYGGCTFCSASGSGDFAEHGDIRRQLEQARLRVAAKNRNGKYMAYFQSFTGTYAPVSVLEPLYRAAIEPADVVGLIIGTRPDCLSDDVTDLLKAMQAEKPVTVELGLQTIHDETADRIHRGYHADCYRDAMARLKASGIETVTHIILGLPGETPEMAAQTTREAVACGSTGVKFHLLHILKGTQLAHEYETGAVQCLSLEEYGHWLQLCFGELAADTVVHRITGDGAKRELVAPLWSADKKRVLNYLHRILPEMQG